MGSRWARHSLIMIMVVAVMLAMSAGQVRAQADGLGDTITENSQTAGGYAWTATWTRRPGTNTWDGNYAPLTGQNTVTAVRTFSQGNNICTYVGTIEADGVIVDDGAGHFATATCNGTDPGHTTSFFFTLTLTAHPLALQVWTEAVQSNLYKNPTQYHVGDPLLVCFSLPDPYGAITLTAQEPDGTTTTLGDSGGYGTPGSYCSNSFSPYHVDSQLGQHCIELDATNIYTGSVMSATQCFQAVP